MVANRWNYCNIATTSWGTLIADKQIQAIMVTNAEIQVVAFAEIDVIFALSKIRWSYSWVNRRGSKIT